MKKGQKPTDYGASNIGIKNSDKTHSKGHKSC